MRGFKLRRNDFQQRLDVLEVALRVPTGAYQHLQHKGCFDIGDRDFKLDHVGSGKPRADRNLNQRKHQRHA
jgi:hypothetical protein